MDRSDLANRMKEYYETVPKTRLMRRCPVCVRCDGRSFHTFTRNFKRPFDEILIKSMQETMKYLCENIQGCVLGYVQSDEISLLLIDYKKLNSEAFFDYEVQKMCSIIASMATMKFNKFFAENVEREINTRTTRGMSAEEAGEWIVYHDHLQQAVKKGAMFDARVFNIPKEEVTNYFYWRQLDCTRNSIQMVGQANFSHKELQNKSCSDIQDMLMLQKGINWNDFPTHQKRGSCCIKQYYPNPEYFEGEIDQGIVGSHWIIDTEIPIFKGEDRDYIDRLVYVGE